MTNITNWPESIDWDKQDEFLLEEKPQLGNIITEEDLDTIRRWYGMDDTDD